MSGILHVIVVNLPFSLSLVYIIVSSLFVYESEELLKIHFHFFLAKWISIYLIKTFFPWDLFVT